MCVVKYMKDRYLGVVVYVGKAKFLSETTSIMFVCFIFITAVGRITEPHKAILLSIHIYFLYLLDVAQVFLAIVHVYLCLFTLLQPNK